MNDQSPQLGGQPKDLAPSLARDWAVLKQRPLAWVVNDDPTLITLYSIILRHFYGREPLVFTFGRTDDGFLAHVASLSAEEVPDLILLDDHMPTMRGIYIVREILRPHPLLAETPVVLCTARTGAAYQEAAYEAGYTLVLTIPLDIDTLVTYLDRYLRTPRLRALPHEERTPT